MIDYLSLVEVFCLFKNKPQHPFEVVLEYKPIFFSVSSSNFIILILFFSFFCSIFYNDICSSSCSHYSHQCIQSWNSSNHSNEPSSTLNFLIELYKTNTASLVLPSAPLISLRAARNFYISFQYFAPFSLTAFIVIIQIICITSWRDKRQIWQRRSYRFYFILLEVHWSLHPICPWI